MANDPRPSSRYAQRLGLGSLGGSVLSHLVAVGALGLMLWQTGGRAPEPPPRAVPVVVLTPVPAASPSPLPKAVGDLPVRAKATPTPKPTPTPRPTPKATPAPRPSARPRPTARPSARPTPKPTPTPKLSAEQKQFQVMRQIPYFKNMTDAELRKQKLPPGLKDWGEVIAMTGKLDGLDWLGFAPPPTGKDEPPPDEAPASPQPTPVASVGPDGVHTLTFQQDTVLFVASWRPGDERVSVAYQPALPASPAPAPTPTPSPVPGTAGTFEAPFDQDQDALILGILAAYLEVLASPAP